MQLQIISDDIALIRTLEGINEFSIERIESIDYFNGDVLILSDRIIHHNELKTHLDKHNKTVFYMITNSLDGELEKQIKTICDTLNIYVIKPRQTVEQITKEIYEKTFPNKKSSDTNVVTLFSSVSNVGVTSTTLSLATAISKMTNAKIAVICTNAWDDGTDQIDYKGKYLNEIKTQLTNHLLDKETLINSFHKTDDFYFLAGNQNTKIERLFTVDEIDYLISKSKEVFDLVLIDAGSHFDNANIIQSLTHADLKLLIVNQQKKSVKKFEQIYNNILEPLRYAKTSFLLVINQYSKEPGLSSDKEIHTELNVPYLTSIPDAQILGLYAEANKKILYNMNDHEYIDSINSIAKGIISRTKLNIVNEEFNKKTKSKWTIFSR